MRLFIEHGVKDSPLTKDVCKRFSFVEPEYLDSYSEFFHRKNQDFRFQKSQSPVYILAQKPKGRVVKNPDFCASMYAHNYYYSLSLNCLSDCEYCFLQAHFPSSAFVFFVNIQDYFDDIHALRQSIDGSIMFFASYDNDGFSGESMFPVLQYTLPFFESLHDVCHEVRTKSVIPQHFFDFGVVKNTVFAFSLNAENIVEQFEHKTASLVQRLQALKTLLQKGYRVGIRIEPIILFPGWKEEYLKLFAMIQEETKGYELDSVYYGIIKFPQKMFSKLKKMYPHSPLYSSYFEEYIHNEHTYPREILEEVSSFFIKNTSLLSTKRVESTL